MAQLTREQKEARLDQIEQLMVRRLSMSALRTWAKREWGIAPRTVRDYVREVRVRWAKEADTDDRRTQREHMRQSLNDLYARAMSRCEVVRDGDGNPLIDPGDPDGKRPLMREVPDLRAAVRAAEAICRLDGLYQDRLQLTGRNGVPLPAGQPVNIFVGRSRAELVVYARTGVFPDERPAALPAAAAPG